VKQVIIGMAYKLLNGAYFNSDDEKDEVDKGRY
jgi:hypothetical protein